MDEFVEVKEIRDDDIGAKVSLPYAIRVPKDMLDSNTLNGNKRMIRVLLYVIKELCKKIEVQNG